MTQRPPARPSDSEARPAAPTPSVEILIVSHNTAGLLAECLESIAAHRPSPDTARVAVSVLDNGSTDGSPELVRNRFPDVRLVQSAENLGFALGNNCLAAEASADYVMLLNSDTRFSDDVVTPLLNALRSEPSLCLVAPRLVFPDGCPQYSSERFPRLPFELGRELKGTRLDRLPGRWITRTLARYRRVDEIDHRVAHRADFVWATCWLLPRDEIARHGLFDETFVTYDEDLDFCRRLNDRGGRIAYVPGVQVVHVGGASSTTESKLAMMRQARRLYYARHAGNVYATAYLCLVRSLDRLKSRRSGRNARVGDDSDSMLSACDRFGH